jgi:hypothetical protein
MENTTMMAQAKKNQGRSNNWVMKRFMVLSKRSSSAAGLTPALGSGVP